MSDLNDFEKKYFPDPLLVSPQDVRDVLAHTEIIETEEMDLVCSPGQVWVVEKENQRPLTWEVSLHEDQFWLVVGAVWGANVVSEMKAELEDMLRWEGEGGSCLS